MRWAVNYKCAVCDATELVVVEGRYKSQVVVGLKPMLHTCYRMSQGQRDKAFQGIMHPISIHETT